MVYICPFISNSEKLHICDKRCALYYLGKCSLKVLAESTDKIKKDFSSKNLNH